MNCSDCRYSRPLIDDIGPLLECHRYPPQVLMIDDQPGHGWPTVEETEWCGCFEPNTGSDFYEPQQIPDETYAEHRPGEEPRCFDGVELGGFSGTRQALHRWLRWRT